jgi:CBS domain containing-hemolysin-like protein
MMVLLIFYLVMALGVSFVCSLLEAAFLSMPFGYIGVLSDRSPRTGQRLMHLKTHVDRPLAAILTLNTIAHTVGATGVGAQAQIVFGSTWVALIGAALTLLILLLSEIIPKTLGAIYCKPLAVFTTWTIVGMIYALYPLVVVCDWLSRRVSGKRRPNVLSREEFQVLADMGCTDGAIDPAEARTIKNLLALHEVRVKKIMTPRQVVEMVSADDTVEQVLDSELALRFARMPVYDQSPDQLVGIVLRYQILQHMRSGQTAVTMRQLARPIHAIPETADVAATFSQFVRRREHLFQVVDEYGGTAGIVTLEDAVETLLGEEIVDETDTVMDMRELALRLAQHRRMP